MENELKQKKNTGLYVIIGVLCVMVLVLGGYFVYKEYIEKDKDKEEPSINDSIPKETTCSDCVTTIDNLLLDSEKNIERKILLGEKVLIVKPEKDMEQGISKLIIDGKTLSTVGPYQYFDNLFVIENEVLMVVLGSSDIRSNSYLFYDKDLNEIKVDMTLDNNYPFSMVASSPESVSMSENKIIINATRLTYNHELVLETTSYGQDALCDNDTYNGKHLGELIGAKYTMTYLGNGKFSSFEMDENSAVYVDEKICNN